MNISSNGMGKMNNSFADSDNEIKRYIRILKKRKWVILTTFLTVFVAWLGYVIVYDSAPVYSASALLHFQDSRGQVLNAEGGEKVNESKAAWLEISSLLTQVVEELQLTLSVTTENVSRTNLFEYVNVKPSSVAGFYTVFPGETQYELYYAEQADKAKDQLLLSFLPEDTVQVNNITFHLNEEFLVNSELKQVQFRVSNPERAISTLKSRTSYSWLDRKTKNNLLITATYASPNMAAEVANVLADKFVEFDSYIKNRKSNEALGYLEEQLEVARQDLENSNRRLQRFREMNPQVQEDATTAQISGLEQNKNDFQLKINDMRNRITRSAAATDIEEKINQNRELLSYLLAEGLPSATVFDAEFNQLSTQRDAMIAQKYHARHPKLLEVNAQLEPLFSKIAAAAEEHIGKLENRVATLDRNIDRTRNIQRAMPAKQRQLSELVVDQDVKNALYESVLTKYNQAKINTEVEVGDVFVLDRAVAPPLQGSFSIILKKSLLGLLLGLGMGLGLAIVLEFFDKTVQTAEDLESRLKLPVIGTIPVIKNGEDTPENVKDIKGKRDTKLITLDYSPTLESESYRDLRTKLLFMNQNKNLSSFLLTSLRPSEGKSLTSSNLAITFAQQKISTLLIDADLRRGVLHNVYGNKKKPGLGDFLISKATVDYDNVNKLIQKTIIPNLYLITTGSPIPNPTEMLGSERMVNLLNVLKSRFGMVILDTAPFQASSDSAILSSNVGGVVVVVRADYTNIDQLNQKLHEYPNIRENVLGLVLNMVKMDMKKERYQYSYYNY